MATTTKTAISLPFDLLKRCDALAQDQRLTRSALVAKALEDYLQRRAAEEVTRQFNKVYADNEAGDEIVKQMRGVQRRLAKGQW